MPFTSLTNELTDNILVVYTLLVKTFKDPISWFSDKILQLRVRVIWIDVLRGVSKIKYASKVNLPSSLSEFLPDNPKQNTK